MTGTRRVLHVIDSLVQGGAERLLVTAAEHRDPRYALHVQPLHAFGADDAVPRALRELGVPVHATPARRWHDPRHAVDVLATVRREGIDVVHGHLPYATSVAVAAGRLARRPVVATLHGANDVDHRGRGAVRTAHRLALRRATVVAACAPELAEQARRRLGIRPGRLVVIRNAVGRSAADVDPAAAGARRSTLLHGAAGPLVVSVGNVLPAKAHELLVEAAARLTPRFPGLRVAIVGREDRNAPVVRERVRALGQEGRVVLTGPSDDVAEILAAADLFVLSSVREGLPVALLEALASGTPVVATDVGGVRSVVRDGLSGRVVAPGDAGALAAGIAAALADLPAARRMAAVGRRHVRRAYDADAFGARYGAVYDALVHDRRGP